MTAISPIKLPTLAFVVNPEGSAAIVYDSPTGKRTVLARGDHFRAAEACKFVCTVISFWRVPTGNHTSDRSFWAQRASGELRGLGYENGWQREVTDRQLATVLAKGEV